MGKGDIKSKRGKIHNGSYGVRRKRSAGASAASTVVVKAQPAPKAEAAPKADKKAVAPKKAASKKKAE